MVKALLFLLGVSCAAADLRLGIIGTDTSHVLAFTRILNDGSNPEHVPGARVVAAFKGGSPDLSYSHGRVEKFAAELQSKFGVEFVSDIPTLCRKVDAVLLESVDGRVHLKQAKEVFASGKPVFIDKPLAASLEDAREIARAAEQARVPWFSSSILRFGPIGTTMKFADATGAVVWGPRDLEEHFPLDLSFYAIHSIEALYTLMGTGCEEVRRIVGRDMDIIIGRWKDGRIGTVYALETGGSGALVFRPKEVAQSQKGGGYAPLVREIVQFFQTRRPPVSAAETLEIFAFMEAAQRSKATGGQPMKLQ